MKLFKPHILIIIGSAILGLFLGLLDAVVDHLFFYDDHEDIIAILFPLNNPLELYMRSAILAICLISGLVISKYFKRIVQAESALRENEKKYRALFEHTPVGLGIADIQGNLLAFNDAMMQQGGYTREDIEKIGNVAHLYHDPDVRNRVLALAQQQGFVYQHPVQFKRKDGSVYDTLLSLTPVEIEGQPCWQALVEDITERKETEREMIRIERLNALSELSSGICHNLNNLLTGILGPIDLMQSAKGEEQKQRLLEFIDRSAKRAADLIKRFHQTVEGSDKTQPVLLNAIICQAIADTKPKWQDECALSGIAIQVKEHLTNIPKVSASETDLHAIVVNLIINAIEALPDGGQIDISTQNEDDGVLLVISDNGQGMEEETQQRVFEPFFSTKATVGTGLGLSTAYSAITRWGGKIEVDSELEKGTQLRIWLPRWTETPQATNTASPSSANILILDDDLIVTQYLNHVLANDHQVHAFADAQTALDQFQVGQFDIAFIDLGLPDMLGHHVAQKLRDQDPNLTTILISGWTLEEHDPRLAPFDFFLPKPLREPQQIQDIISKVIQQNQTQTEP